MKSLDFLIFLTVSFKLNLMLKYFFDRPFKTVHKLPKNLWTNYFASSDSFTLTNLSTTRH